MKHYFIFLIFVIGLLIGSQANASMYPNDALTAYTLTTTGGLTTCNNLLNATTTPITILYASIRTGIANTAKIKIGGLTWVHSFGLTGFFEAPVPIVVNNENITCERETGIANFYRIVYVPYDLTKVSTSTNIIINYSQATSTIGSTTPMTFFNNIAQIGYTATTTLTASGQSITTGYYYIPFILFKFILIVICLTIMTVLILLFFNKKTKWI